ncbi:MAG: hypothetical protein ACLU99_00770 [Alphaproteobacteria bacterium]
MRAQPLHIGHERVLRDMLEKCARVTVILGSIQEQGTARNPFTYLTRKQMILNIFQNETARLKVMGLFDINNPTQWSDFVLDFMRENMPEWGTPDVYYAGALMMLSGLPLVLSISSVLTEPIPTFLTFQEAWCAI